MSNNEAAQEIIAKDCVVGMNYHLTNKKGEVLDDSEGTPLEYLQGHQNIIDGLDKAMEGHKTGDKFTVTIPAKDAYGEVNPSLIIPVDREQIGTAAGEPQVGMGAKLSTDMGMIMARIIEVTDKEVIFDANHPLAGEDLTFDVEVVSIRKATEEEIKNGGLHSHCSGSCSSCHGCGE